MKFKNETKQRIKYALRGTCPEWVTVRPGDEAELEDEATALAHGLTKVEEVKAEESSIGETKVETKIKRGRKARKEAEKISEDELKEGESLDDSGEAE